MRSDSIAYCLWRSSCFQSSIATAHVCLQFMEVCGCTSNLVKWSPMLYVVVVSYLVGLYTWVYGPTQIALYLLVRGWHVVDPKRCVQSSAFVAWLICSCLYRHEAIEVHWIHCWTLPGIALINSLCNAPLMNVFPVKKFPSFYRTCKFITLFTSPRNWSISCARLIQFTHSHPISLMPILLLSSHLFLVYQMSLTFPNKFFTQFSQAFIQAQISCVPHNPHSAVSFNCFHRSQNY
jgi:hypothetical protein